MSFREGIPRETAWSITSLNSSLVINLFSLAVPLVTLQVYDRILAFQSIGTLQVLVAGVAVIVALDIVLRLCRSSMIGWASARFEHAAFSRTLRHLMGAKFRGSELVEFGVFCLIFTIFSRFTLTNRVF